MDCDRLVAVGVFLVICTLMSVSICFAEQSGPVIAIDLETSASPDLSRIDSVYYGDAEFIYAFLVVNDMPAGYVSGYDLGFEIAPGDAGLTNYGFTRMPGWVCLSSSDSLPPKDISLPGIRTPAAIGFWKIELDRGYASTGHIALSANSETSGEAIWLLDSRGEGITPERVHSASVNPTSGLPREWVPDRVDYVRFNCRGERLQESRAGGFAPGMVIARFAPGAVELPQGHLGTVEHILSRDIRAIAEQFGMNEVERLYSDAARGDRWITSRTGHLVKALNLWDVYVLHFPEDAALWDIVDSLRTMPECFYAELNLLGESCSAPNDTLYKYKHRQWNVDQVGLPSAWDIQAGGTYSVGIGVLDTGIDYNHVDLGQGWGEGHKIRGGWNYVDDSPDFMDDADTAYTSHDSHGTMVSGIAAALTHNHHGLAGVAGGWAPTNLGCALYGLKTSNYLAIPQADAIAEAIQEYSLNDYGVDIFNGSVTIVAYLDLVREALYQAYIADRVFVASKANDGSSDPSYPADYDDDWVICVGGSDRPGSYPDVEQRRHVNQGYDTSSGYGGGLDLLAPSVELWSTCRTVHTKKYREDEGNSGAAPHVSGIAGLVLSECDTLRAEDVQGLLTASCTDIIWDEDADPYEDLTGYDQWSGWGRVKARKSLEFLHEPWSMNRFTSTGGQSVWTDDAHYHLFLGNGPLSGFAYCKRHKVHCDVTYPVQYTDFRHVWGLGHGMTVGWSGAYPCYQIGHCRPLLETMSSTGCTFETWVYELKDPLSGATIAWHPCRPSQAVIAYTVLGTTCASVETDESGPVAHPAGSIRVLANPTRHDVKATFTIEQPGETRVEVYDVKGTLVRCLDCLYLKKGSHSVVWDGNDRNGQPVPPGVYFLQVTSIRGSTKAKVVRLR